MRESRGAREDARLQRARLTLVREYFHGFREHHDSVIAFGSEAMSEPSRILVMAHANAEYLLRA